MADFLNREEINALLDVCEDSDKGVSEDITSKDIQITFEGIKIDTDEFIKNILKENWKYCKKATIKEI